MSAGDSRLTEKIANIWLPAYEVRRVFGGDGRREIKPGALFGRANNFIRGERLIRAG